MRFFFITVTLAVAIIGITLLLVTTNTEASYKLIDGQVITSKDLKGKPALINFWSVSCAPCLEEIPDLNMLFQQYKNQGVSIIGVAMPYDPPNLVLELHKKLNIEYPIALDIDKKVTALFNPQFVPTTFLLDKKGKIAHTIVGKVDAQKIASQLYSLLEG